MISAVIMRKNAVIARGRRKRIRIKNTQVY